MLTNTNAKLTLNTAIDYNMHGRNKWANCVTVQKSAMTFRMACSLTVNIDTSV